MYMYIYIWVVTRASIHCRQVLPHMVYVCVRTYARASTNSRNVYRVGSAFGYWVPATGFVPSFFHQPSQLDQIDDL